MGARGSGDAGQAAAWTAASGGAWEVEAGPVGWRLRPAPGSGYPAVRALTEARLFRRLAVAATPTCRTEP